MPLVVMNPPASARDVGDGGSIPGSGRSPGGGHGNPLQHSCLENPMDRSVGGCSPQCRKASDATEASGHTRESNGFTKLLAYFAL